MVSPYMTNPFAGLQQGMQAAGGLIDMFNAPRDRAFAMEQARQKMALQQAQLGQGQQRIDLAKQEQDRLAKASQREQEQAQTLAFGRLAKIYQGLPEEEREQFLIDTKALHGMDPGQVTDEMVSNLSSAYDAMAPTTSKVGRYKQSVVGGKLNVLDSVTGQSKVIDLQPGMEAPESFTPEQKKQWNSLSSESQQRLIEKQLDPNAQIKLKDKLGQIKKREQFQKIAIKLIDGLLSNKELNDVIGPVEGRVDFRLSDNEAGLVADIKELSSILTADNLDLMVGVLSESDIAMLKQISAGGLDKTRGETEFISRLKYIRDSLTKLGKQSLESELETLEREMGLIK